MTITVLNTGPVRRCLCGCGEPTGLHARTCTRLGHVKGETYHDYIKGHWTPRGPRPDAQMRRRQRVEHIRELHASGLRYREIGERLGVSTSTICTIMADPDRVKARASAARYRDRHRVRVNRNHRQVAKRYRARKKAEHTLLDGPEFVKWLAAQAITPTSVVRNKEFDNERRLRSWAAGQNVRLTTADRFLTDHGHHLHQLPESLWV